MTVEFDPRFYRRRSTKEMQLITAEAKVRKAYNDLNDAYEVMFLQNKQVTIKAKAHHKMCRELYDSYYEEYRTLKERLQ